MKKTDFYSDETNFDFPIYLNNTIVCLTSSENKNYQGTVVNITPDAIELKIHRPKSDFVDTIIFLNKGIKKMERLVCFQRIISPF